MSEGPGLAMARDGVFFAAQRIYGLRFEERTDLVAYHKDARVFEVFEEDGTPLGPSSVARRL